MQIIARVGLALRTLFGPIAEEAAVSSGVIVRKRKFDALSLARTFVLGFLQKPSASDADLAAMAVQCGADVSPQAVEQRHTPKLVKFFQELFYKTLKVAVAADKALAPILERFTSVIVLDSTTITLPDSMAEEYPGCGGSYGGGKAAVKFQVEWDLRSGAMAHVEVEPGRSPDGATARQQVRRGKGSLRISDLGYFNLTVFAAMHAAGEYFLSRLQPGTHVHVDANPLALVDWLNRQMGSFVDAMVELGQEQRLPCRLIAWRMPTELADRCRQKLRAYYRDKYGKEPSAERLALCGWTILVTNVPPEMLSPKEAVVLYRARWQIELLFKRWKSQGLIADLQGSTDVRQMVRLWARLLATIVQHWLVIGTAWDPAQSLTKVGEAIRHFVGRLAAALNCHSDLHEVLADLKKTVQKTCRRNKRRAKPGTFELLNDVELLEFQLT